MSKQRYGMPDVSRVVAMRDSAPRGALAMPGVMTGGRYPDPRAQDQSESIEVIAKHLGETKEVVADMLRSWSDFSKAGAQTQSEIQARLATIEQLVAKNEALGTGVVRGSGGPSIGAQFAHSLNENDQFASMVQAAQREMKLSSFSVRTTVDGSIHAALTNEGWTSSNGASIPSDPERRGIVGPVGRPLRLLDVLPSRPTERDAVEFVQLTVTGNAAEQEEEGDEKAKLDFDGQLARAEICTIAGWTGASKQVLADHVALQAQIDRVIRNKVLSRLEHQLINGDGSPGKIKGLLNQSAALIPLIATTPADIIGEGLVRMAEGGYMPNLVLLHPLDWFRIQIEKTNTEGEYIFGSPTMPVPPALWNTAIVRTPSIPEGTGMVLDTSFTTLLDRQQMNVMVSNSHADFFTRNLVAILGELRAGLEVLDEFAVYRFDLDTVSSE